MFVILDLESCYVADFGALQNQRIQELTGAQAIATPNNLTPLRDADKVFVTGSAGMVADVPWVMEVGQAIHDAAASGTEVLGVCFGHQLMAHHFGGAIGSFEKVRRGINRLSFDGSGPFPARALDVLHSHRDHVLDGGDMIACATGGFGGIPGLRHPDLPIWTTQGHVEWTGAMGAAISDDWETPPQDTPGTADIVRRFAN